MTDEFLEEYQLDSEMVSNIQSIKIEHTYCLDQTKQSNLNQQVKVSYTGDGSMGFDIGYRTRVLNQDKMTYFTDDSLNLVQRPLHTTKSAEANL